MAAWTRDLRLVPSHRSTAGELPASPVLAVYESTDPCAMVVLRKEPAGEADAWNAGVNAAASPVMAFFDPETEFAPESLLRLIRPMLYEPDLVFAVCGWTPRSTGPRIGWRRRRYGSHGVCGWAAAPRLRGGRTCWRRSRARRFWCGATPS